MDSEYFILTIWDAILSPLYIAFILIFSNTIQHRNQGIYPEYRYYSRGLLVKIIGSVSVCLIYQYYYPGGDTTNYFNTSKAIFNLSKKDFWVFLKVMLGDNSPENFSYFDESTSTPFFWLDKNGFTVSCIAVPFYILGLGSFIPTTLLYSLFCYSGIWKLFTLFNSYFPKITDKLAIAILFIPSVVFWGSGILKDPLTISAVGWYTYSFHDFFIKRKYLVKLGAYIFISAAIIIMVKPYIFFALLPGSIIWLTDSSVSKIKNNFMRASITPLILVLGIAIGYYSLTKLGDFLGVYRVDKVLERAVVVQTDLKQDYYKGHTFDIGKVDANLSSMLSKAHLALGATFFRPFLWEVKNMVMFFSGLENTYILILTIVLLFKLKVLGFFNYIRKSPILFFSFLFAMFFGFSVGIATPNYGALVRLKIPCIPFYVVSLFIIKHMYETEFKIKLKI